jgi:hypothetical protein
MVMGTIQSVNTVPKYQWNLFFGDFICIRRFSGSESPKQTRKSKGKKKQNKTSITSIFSA